MKAAVIPQTVCWSVVAKSERSPAAAASRVEDVIQVVRDERTAIEHAAVIERHPRERSASPLRMHD